MILIEFDKPVLEVRATRKCNQVDDRLILEILKNGGESSVFDFDYLEKISLHYLEKISMIYSSFYCYLNVFISLIFLRIENRFFIVVKPVLIFVKPVMDAHNVGGYDEIL